MKATIVPFLCITLFIAFPELAGAQWATNGNALSTANSHQTSPVATPDGAGGAIVVWQDPAPGLKRPPLTEIELWTVVVPADGSPPPCPQQP